MKVWILAEKYQRARDAFANALARLLPRRVAYWSLIRAGVEGMEPGEIVPEVPFTTVLERAGQRLR